MTVPSVIYGHEHDALLLENFPDIKKYLENSTLSRQNAEMLGLHWGKGGICPDNFVGMVWLGAGEHKTVLRVDSKFPQMDYVKMFAECAAHAEIGGRMDGCLRFWPEDDLIPVPDNSDFLILTAVAYLRELNELCRRRLRRHFLRERQNFTGKVKGKIIIGENLRQNIVRSRPDRIFCEYQSVSDDILENRILRAALERAARYVSQTKNSERHPILPQWIRASRAALQGVSISPIKRRDFAAARKRGVFAHYARPLKLAEAVLRQLGFNPREEIVETKTPPFALDMAELFERYAELQLLGKHPKLKAARQNISGSSDGFVPAARPDFYVPAAEGETPYIIDAKYKENLIAEAQPSREDVSQIVAYSRHRGVMGKIDCAPNDNVKLSLAYPFFGGNNDVETYATDNSYFAPLHFYKIKCPVK